MALFSHCLLAIRVVGMGQPLAVLLPDCPMTASFEFLRPSGVVERYFGAFGVYGLVPRLESRPIRLSS
jgi:hypothetical protein